MNKDYRRKFLESYLSTGYEIHKANITSLGDDLKRNLIFFKHNYKHLLPKNKSARILELGIGKGQFLEFLKREGYLNVLGIDASDEVLEYCRAQGFSVQKSNIVDFWDEDPTQHFDCIIANDLIEHFDRNEAIAICLGVHTYLKPGGSFIIKTPNASNIFLGSYSRSTDLTHEFIYTEQSIGQLLRSTNFNQIKFYDPNLFCFYKNPLNYIGKAADVVLKLIQRAIHRINGSFYSRFFGSNLLIVATKDESINKTK